MKHNVLLIRLSILIALLALVAAVLGLFGQGSGAPQAFITARGESVQLYGHGLYRYDSVNGASQMMGQDAVTLILAVPLLVVAILLTRKGSLRGRLLLTGALGYFLYTYASMAFLTAFNALFLLYVALFSLSLFAFILALSGLDPEFVTRQVGEGFPRTGIIVLMFALAAFLTVAWLGRIRSVMQGVAGANGLESYTTLVIQALDLGVIVPTALLTAVLLLKKNPWGYTLSSVLLCKAALFGAALIAMIVSQTLAGVPLEPVISALFVVIILVSVFLTFRMLRSIREVQHG